MPQPQLVSQLPPVFVKLERFVHREQVWRSLSLVELTSEGNYEISEGVLKGGKASMCRVEKRSVPVEQQRRDCSCSHRLSTVSRTGVQSTQSRRGRPVYSVAPTRMFV